MQASLTVAHLCQRTVVTVQEHISVKDAAELMRKNHIGCLVVVRGERPTVVGLLTDRDITIVAVARDFDPLTLRVGDVMTTQVHTVSAATPTLSALQTMRRHGVRRLPVVGDFDDLVGILTLDDLLNAYAAELALFAQAMQRGRQTEARVRG